MMMNKTYPAVNLRVIYVGLRPLWFSSLNINPPSKIHLSDAIILCGYSSLHGQARYFLKSARLFGLIDFDIKEHYIKFTPLAQKLFTEDSLEALATAMFTPQLFSAYQFHAGDEFKLYSPQIIEFFKNSDLPLKEQHPAALSFSQSLEFLRGKAPQRPHNIEVASSTDGTFSIKFIHGISEKEFDRNVDEIKKGIKYE